MNIRDEYEKNKDLVQLKETSNPDLFVLKYRKKVFFKNLWNDFLRECRGLIVDKEFNIVAYPFTKIHNFRVEADAPVLTDDTKVDYVRKVNGFMVAMTAYKGEVLISTTGSIDSDFVSLARKYVTKELTECILSEPKFTFMFECCDPSDPHIVHEQAGLYLLGAREKKFDSIIVYGLLTEVWATLGVHTIPVERGTVGEVMQKLKTVTHEGFVLYTYENNLLCTKGSNKQIVTKCKSPHYLTKKLFMRGNMEKLLKRDAKQLVDEEYYPLLEYVKDNKEFEEADELLRRSMIEDFFHFNSTLVF